MNYIMFLSLTIDNNFQVYKFKDIMNFINFLYNTNYTWKEKIPKKYNKLVIVFNWNHFEMRLLNLRINFYLLQTFCPHLGSFLCRVGMLSLVTVSPVITAFQLWKAVITGDTVTRLSIPILGRGKSPEEG